MPEINKSIFCIVDIQEKFVPAIPDIQTTMERVKIMIRATTELNIPIIVTEQYPQGLGSTVAELKEILPSDTRYITKTSFSCIGDESFRKAMMESGRKALFLAGIESHICVFQTAVESLAHGYEVYVIADAVASRRDVDRNTALAELRHAGVKVLNSESVIFMLLRDASHPSFRAISKIIR